MSLKQNTFWLPIVICLPRLNGIQCCGVVEKAEISNNRQRGFNRYDNESNYLDNSNIMHNSFLSQFLYFHQCCIFDGPIMKKGDVGSVPIPWGLVNHL